MTITSEQLEEAMAIAKKIAARIKQKKHFYMADLVGTVAGSEVALLAQSVPALVSEVERLHKTIREIHDHIKGGDDNGAYLIARAALEEPHG